MKLTGCVYCDGDGWIRVQASIRTVAIGCPICGGQGKVFEEFDQETAIRCWEQRMGALNEK